MSKATISIAVISAVLCGSAACKKDEVEREAEDVREAKKDVQEEKRELQEEKAELSAEIQAQMSELERRYTELDAKAQTAVANLDTSTGPGAEIQQHRTLAQAKLEAARNAKTPEQTESELRDARDALDKLERNLEQNQPTQ